MRLDQLDWIIQPGWQNSSALHWQSHWQKHYGAKRVDHDNWLVPELGIWVEALAKQIRLARRPVLIVAHSLGCITLSHYARQYGGVGIAAALLVAPADVEQTVLPLALQNFGPIPLQKLPFPSLVIASTNDPYCAPVRAQWLAKHWGSACQFLEQAGHINTESGHQTWPEGMVLLANWLKCPDIDDRR